MAIYGRYLCESIDRISYSTNDHKFDVKVWQIMASKYIAIVYWDKFWHCSDYLGMDLNDYYFVTRVIEQLEWSCAAIFMPYNLQAVLQHVFNEKFIIVRAINLWV